MDMLWIAAPDKLFFYEVYKKFKQIELSLKLFPFLLHNLWYLCSPDDLENDAYQLHSIKLPISTMTFSNPTYSRTDWSWGEYGDSNGPNWLGFLSIDNAKSVDVLLRNWNKL